MYTYIAVGLITDIVILQDVVTIQLS